MAGMKPPVDIPMTCHTWLTHAIPKVRAAMEHAWNKHGEPTKDPQRGALNLCEEAGEVASAALEATRQFRSHFSKDHELYVRSKAIHDTNVGDSERAMINELWQVAGYAILLAVQLEGKQGTYTNGDSGKA